jgi:hypothetical protein
MRSLTSNRTIRHNTANRHYALVSVFTFKVLYSKCFGVLANMIGNYFPKSSVRQNGLLFCGIKFVIYKFTAQLCRLCPPRVVVSSTAQKHKPKISRQSPCSKSKVCQQSCYNTQTSLFLSYSDIQSNDPTPKLLQPQNRLTKECWTQSC